jgi:hypothetical protein
MHIQFDDLGTCEIGARFIGIVAEPVLPDYVGEIVSFFAGAEEQEVPVDGTVVVWLSDADTVDEDSTALQFGSCACPLGS